MASPVFATELERWAGDNPKLRVVAVGPTVQALVEFLYTGTIQEGVDYTALLILAHRYQIDDLIALAKDQILDTATPETVVPAARALRLLRDEDEYDEDWAAFCAKASKDPAMFEALALAI